MGSNRTGMMRGLAVALATTIALAGCTIPFINVEIPFGLPEADSSDSGLPSLTLPIGVNTSVDEARQEALAKKSSTISSSALVNDGVLTVGLKTTTSSAPLCVEGDAGSVYGLDVDVAAAVASEMGLSVRYVPVTDASSLGTECDVIMNGRSGNPDAIAIAGTYVESATCFFHRGDATVSAVTDLSGKSVAVQGGSVSETVLDGTGLMMSKQTYVNLNEAFDALAAGQVDYVLCEAYPGAYLATLHGSISFAGALETPETSGIAVDAENTALVGSLRAAFDAISSNGILNIARSRWVGTMPTLTSESLIQDVPSSGEEPASEDASTQPAASSEDATNTTDGSDAGSNAITTVG